MTEKVKKKWISMGRRTRLTFIMLCATLLALPIIAVAGGGITFDAPSPTNGAVTGNTTPTISINASAATGSVTQSDVRMYLKNDSVNPSLTSISEGKYKISYTPVQKLVDGTYPVSIEVYDSSKGSNATTNWTFTVDAVPNPSGWYPGKGSKITTSSPTLSLYVKDPHDDLNTASIVVTLDDTVIAHKWNPVTHIYTQKEGTITANTSNLSDGVHTVEFKISDKAGNTLTEAWSFTVAEAPKFNNLTPINQSKQKAVSQVSAVISDNSSIDWNTAVLKLNGTAVTPTIDQNTNTVTYNSNLASNNYTASLQIKDTAGNLGSKTWSFTVDSTPPAINYLFDFSDGMNLLDGNLKIRVGLKDLVNIKNNATLSLNGSPLNIKFRHEGYVDSYTGNWVVTDEKVAHIEYTGTVPNGSHRLLLVAEDELGNKLEKTWTFTVTAAPVISNQSPIKYGVTELTPLISAVVKSPNGTIDPALIELKLNGVKVAHNYDSTTGKVSFTPTSSLANESYHTVSLTVADSAGKSETTNWKFYISTYSDMADSNISNCTSCHALKTFTGSNGPFEDVHSSRLSFGGGHKNNYCNNCHDYISQPAACGQCHSGEDFIYTPHGTSSALKYTAKNYNQFFPLRVKENRELWDCIVCHQPGAATKGYSGNETTPTRLLNNHDIPELHKTTETDFQAKCSKCHATSMTREHAREGRVDTNNQAITCKTCHESTNAKVTAAIEGNLKGCSDCHENTDHQELHTYTPLNSDCTSCHSNILSVEHDKPLKGLDCNTCHSSTKQNVNLAISWNQRSCSDCHSGAKHGVALATSVPAILKYQPSTGSLKWMNPESLDFWAGEAWIPEGMAGGYLVLSNRSQNLSATAVLNYYKTELSKAGWVEEKTISSDTKFELVYKKGTAKVVIRFYNGEHYDSTSGLSQGYRIEIVYKQT